MSTPNNPNAILQKMEEKLGIKIEQPLTRETRLIIIVEELMRRLGNHDQEFPRL